MSETIRQAPYCQPEPLEVLSLKLGVDYRQSAGQTCSTLIFLAKRVGTRQGKIGLDWGESKNDDFSLPWLYRIERGSDHGA